MKSSTQNPSPVATRSISDRRLSGLLDDLRLIHRAETTRINGRDVDVCAVCRPTSALDERLAVATSGRELWPCPTLRLTRRAAGRTR